LEGQLGQSRHILLRNIERDPGIGGRKEFREFWRIGWFAVNIELGDLQNVQKPSISSGAGQKPFHNHTLLHLAASGGSYHDSAPD
jgi:hypothetical protein